MTSLVLDPVPGGCSLGSRLSLFLWLPLAGLYLRRGERIMFVLPKGGFLSSSILNSDSCGLHCRSWNVAASAGSPGGYCACSLGQVLVSIRYFLVFYQ